MIIFTLLEDIINPLKGVHSPPRIGRDLPRMPPHGKTLPAQPTIRALCPPERYHVIGALCVAGMCSASGERTSLLAALQDSEVGAVVGSVHPSLCSLMDAVAASSAKTVVTWSCPQQVTFVNPLSNGFCR